jgi:hypothetical protein
MPGNTKSAPIVLPKCTKCGKIPLHCACPETELKK